MQTGIGPVEVQRVKLRDRAASEAGAERIRFTSAILPRWARRTRSLDALLPVLYLRGVSMGDFQEALGALLGQEAPNLSPSVIARLRDEWQADYTRWQRRDLGVSRSESAWVGPAVCLRVGGRHLPAGAHGAASRMHAGADRGHARGQEGTGPAQFALRIRWLPGGPAGKCPKLARAAGRPQSARPGHRAGAGDRRRGAWLLEGAGRGVTDDAAPALHRAHHPYAIAWF